MDRGTSPQAALRYRLFRAELMDAGLIRSDDASAEPREIGKGGDGRRAEGTSEGEDRERRAQPKPCLWSGGKQRPLK